jgi:hypothetical protein
MKNSITRVLISAVVFSLLAAIIIVIIGVIRKWSTPEEFSNGFFWAGAIVLMAGAVNSLSNLYQPTGSAQYMQSVGVVDRKENMRIWQEDVLHGYHLLAFLGIAGVLLLGYAVLILEVGKRISLP